MSETMNKIIVEGQKLRKIFKYGLFGRKRIVAVDDVSIRIYRRETVVLLGESGSGKSTLGKILLLLLKPDIGRVYFHGRDITDLNHKELKEIRRKMQLIPQNPESALDPRWKIYDSLAEPLRIHRIFEKREEEENRILELIEMVNLDDELLYRYPHELSGGELQRIVIARALSLNPEFIVCDEPTSMLDVSTQASIIRLLLKLQKKFGISYLFITHDIELARIIADRILIMKKGKIISEIKLKKRITI